MDNLNNSKSNLLETKLKKFEAQYSTLGDLHFPTKDYSTPRSVTPMYCGRGNKSNRKNFSNKMKHQEDFTCSNIYNQWKISRHFRGRYQNDSQKPQNGCSKPDQNDDNHYLF